MAEGPCGGIVLFRSLELVLGIISFALYKAYDFITCTIIIPTEFNSAKCTVPVDFGRVAVIAFPLLIIPIFIATHLKYGRKFEPNVMNPMIAFVGFLVFIVAGSVQLSRVVDYMTNSSGNTALGAMCIITGLVFLGDILFWFKRQFLSD